MKRILAILLTLVLLLPAVAIGEKFSPSDIRDARAKALELFHDCAFGSGESARDNIIRWEGAIRIFAAGKPGKKDLQELDKFILELQLRVPGLPSVTRVTSEDGANLIIRYNKAKELPDLIPSYTKGSQACFTVTHSAAVISKGEIGLTTDKMSQKNRNHMMREMLVGALGLTKAHSRYTDSILYHNKKNQSLSTVTLSEADWLMLNYLYSPLVPTGSGWEAIHQTLKEHYGF
ncbi:MAG: DUF2927 domain-containing protein [Clostridia bacterium]|nr:DUF2927 domain-containing protein [Clostridia bacterium]